MSTQRKIVFANNSYYHVYNRGYDRREIFGIDKEYKRAMATVRYYRFGNLIIPLSRYLELSEKAQKVAIRNIEKNKNQLVEIVSYCLMPNHFHFLLKQLKDDGIKDFIGNFSNSYTKYYNTRHQRSSSLLQGTFKAVYIETNEQLLHLSRYIHLNPIKSSRVDIDNLEDYRWSSYREYLGLDKEKLCDPGIVLSQFKNSGKYEDFVKIRLQRPNVLEEIDFLKLE